MWVKIRVLFQLARIKGERQIHSFKKIEVRARKLNFFPPACIHLHYSAYQNLLLLSERSTLGYVNSDNTIILLYTASIPRGAMCSEN